MSENVSAVIATLQRVREDKNGLNDQIKAVSSFAESIGIDPEFQKRHRKRSRPQKVDEHPETVVTLPLIDHYGKNSCKFWTHRSLRFVQIFGPWRTFSNLW